MSQLKKDSDIQKYKPPLERFVFYWSLTRMESGSPLNDLKAAYPGLHSWREVFLLLWHKGHKRYIHL
jgi:hypothetical protein